jgi:hypothetical protein
MRTVVLALTLISALGLPLARPQEAAAAGCYDSARIMHNRLLFNREWSDWRTEWTTSNCADLNLKVVTPDPGCTVWVHAMYWDPSRGQWIKGAAGSPYVAMKPGVWSTPLTRLNDPTYIAWRYYLSCDHEADASFVTSYEAY